MSSLTAYLDTRNAFARLFGRRQLSLQNSADRQALADMIDSALSPENLSCDGELSRAEVNRRYRELMAVKASIRDIENWYEDDGQPDTYTEYQDVYGGDDAFETCNFCEDF